jgi:predicted RNase H-like nuclease (RuvC/YqgF family)
MYFNSYQELPKELAEIQQRIEIGELRAVNEQLKKRVETLQTELHVKNAEIERLENDLEELENTVKIETGGMTLTMSEGTFFRFIEKIQEVEY